MTKHKHPLRLVPLFCMLGLISMTPTHTFAERGQEENRFFRDELALQLPNRTAATKRIAHERYAFLKRIMSRTPGFYLLGTEEHYDTLLFPVGSSDRAYAIELPSNDNWYRPHYRVSCYQRKNGRDVLVYRVDLEERDRILKKRRPAKKVARIQSLLDYLTDYTITGYVALEGRHQREHLITFAVRGRLTKFARSDLSAKRDYVEYGVSLGENALYVSLFPANQGSAYTSGEVYALDYDPYRKVTLKDDQFYLEYGLPVAKQELPRLQ